MRAISKGPEPTTLRAYRAVPGATYDGKDFTPVKADIRDALVRDQLALCCYCMRRISTEERAHPTNPNAPAIVQMKVEHWQSQNAHPHRQLAWDNLLGACLGGMGSPPSDQTCDTRKGEDAINLNPLDTRHVATLYCTSNGRLASKDANFQRDIDDVLGLNHQILVNGRKIQLGQYIDRLRARYPRGEFPLSAVRRLIVEAETPSEGKLREHACVLRLWARKRYGELL